MEAVEKSNSLISIPSYLIKLIYDHDRKQSCIFFRDRPDRHGDAHLFGRSIRRTKVLAHVVGIDRIWIRIRHTAKIKALV